MKIIIQNLRKLFFLFALGTIPSIIFAATTDADFTIENNKSLKLTGNGTDTISIKAPATLTTNVVLTLPDNIGNSNQILQTDGDGNLSWIDNTGVAVEDSLLSTQTSTALSANQGRILDEIKINLSDISDDESLGSDTQTVVSQRAIKTYVDNNATVVIDDLTSTSGTKSLSANQGKILNEKVILLQPLDEDDFISNSNTKTATQQSIKAYVDNNAIQIVDDLLSTSSTKALSANQGRLLNETKFNVDDIIDTLTSNVATKALSANMGFELDSKKINISDISDDINLGTETSVVASQNAIKSYVDNSIGSATLSVWQEVYTASITVDASSTNIKTFTNRTIKDGRKVYVSFNVPYKSTIDTNGGLAVGLFAKINGGDWIYLGSSGYIDEGSDLQTKFRRVIANEYVFDFDSNELGSSGTDYEVQFALVGKATDGTVEVNPTDAINISIDAPDSSSPVLKSWAGQQNFVNLIIKEL